MKIKKTLVGLLLAGVMTTCSLAFVGCGDKNDDNTSSTSTQDTATDSSTKDDSRKGIDDFPQDGASDGAHEVEIDVLPDDYAGKTYLFYNVLNIPSGNKEQGKWLRLVNATFDSEGKLASYKWSSYYTPLEGGTEGKIMIKDMETIVDETNEKGNYLMLDKKTVSLQYGNLDAVYTPKSVEALLEETFPGVTFTDVSAQYS